MQRTNKPNKAVNILLLHPVADRQIVKPSCRRGSLRSATLLKRSARSKWIVHLISILVHCTRPMGPLISKIFSNEHKTFGKNVMQGLCNPQKCYGGITGLPYYFSSFNSWCPMKRSYMLKQTFSFQIQDHWTPGVKRITRCGKN